MPLVRSRQYLTELRDQHLVGELVVLFQVIHRLAEVHLLDDGADLGRSLLAPFFALSRRSGQDPPPCAITSDTHDPSARLPENRNLESTASPVFSGIGPAGFDSASP